MRVSMFVHCAQTLTLAVARLDHHDHDDDDDDRADKQKLQLREELSASNE